MKAILLSIRPIWCELIAKGEKTVEVRKTRPKLDTPFKAYIYCTKGGPHLNSRNGRCYLEEKDVLGGRGCGIYRRLNGMVIGEFVCDRIEEAYQCHSGYIQENACLSAYEFFQYLGIPQGTHLGYEKKAYAWHISDVVIYDLPKELGEFHFLPDRYCEKNLCGGCPFDESPDMNGEYMYGCDWERPVMRPPQSWCYVEAI